METIDLAYWNFLRSLKNAIIVCKVSPHTRDRTCTWICTSKKDFQSLTSFSSPGSANDPKRVTDRYSHPPPTRQPAELLDGPNQKCCDSDKTVAWETFLMGHYQARKSPTAKLEAWTSVSSHRLSQQDSPWLYEEFDQTGITVNVDEHSCREEVTVSPVGCSSSLQSNALAQLGTVTFHSLPCPHIFLLGELQIHQVNQRYKDLWNPKQHWIFGMTSWLYMGTNKRQRFPEAAGYKV